MQNKQTQHFQDFMVMHFVPKTTSDVIAAGREVVADTGLYITKKRYAVLFMI